MERTEFLGQILNFFDGLSDLCRIGQDDFDFADPVTPVRVVDHNVDFVLQYLICQVFAITLMTNETLSFC